VTRSSTGEFSASVGGLKAGVAYEFRAVAKHLLVTVAGEDAVVGVR
jgi:hypothetical protein